MYATIFLNSMIDPLNVRSTWKQIAEERCRGFEMWNGAILKNVLYSEEN